jgi:hypothetical protein
MWKEFDELEKIVSPLKPRKNLNAEICYEGSTLSMNHILKLQEYIMELNENGSGVTLKKLRKKLFAEFSVEVRNHIVLSPTSQLRINMVASEGELRPKWFM